MTDDHRKPPRLAEWLLRSFCSYDFLSTALWDLDEMYEMKLKEKGRPRANLIYYKEVLAIIYHLYFKGKSQHSPNHIAMVKNNILVSLRNFRKNKSNSLIHVLGLSSALVAFLLTFTYTSYEFSFDTYHKEVENIYRVYKSINTIDEPDYRDAGTPGPLAAALIEEFPAVTSAARMIGYRKILMETKTKTFVEPQVYPTDASIFRVFSFESVSGNIDEFLSEPFTVAISESTALKYFNKIDVVGETITFAQALPMKVSGVFKDMPDNSHLKLKVLAHFESVMEAFQQSITRWGNNPYFTYIRTEAGTDADILESQLPMIRAKYADDPVDVDGQEYTYFLQPWTDVHFNQRIDGGLVAPVDGQRFYVFMAIAIVILAMACINYINLATARSISRMKEVGIRKVIGAGKDSLIMQFLVESGLLVFTSLIVAVLVSSLLLPLFAEFVNKPLVLGFQKSNFWISLLGLGFSLTLISGIYPAIATANFKPLNALYGRGEIRQKRNLLRNGLVVFQFTISAALIIGAIILTQQLNFIDDSDIGYSRDRVVILNTNDDIIEGQLPQYMDALTKVSGVSAVATSWSLPTNVTSDTRANWQGITDAERLPMSMIGVTHEFFDLFEIDIVEGRAFDPAITADEQAILLNETAVKALGWKDPIGREMITQKGVNSRVIGVVKDFHMKSLREEIRPLQILLSDQFATLSVKIDTDINQTLAKIEEIYESFSPAYPFEYTYFGDIYEEAYTEEIKTAQLTQWITILAIIIACLGLYGLATHKVEDKMKELGVRKVLGASVPAILGLLSRDFVKLLVIAFLIAAPIAYYLMDGWLNGFAYHINIGAFTLFITLLTMIVVAGATVGYRTYRAAVRNPIEALREE